MQTPRAYVLLSALAASLGGLLFGFDTAVISGTTEALERVFIDVQFDSGRSFWKGFTVAVALIGTIVGAMGVGYPSERIGRRGTLSLLGALFLVSALGCAFAWDWYSLVVFRFIGGLGIGGASVVAPMYIAEISPAKFRGRLAGLAQFNIVLGILLAFLSNYLVQRFGVGVSGAEAGTDAYTAWLDERGWRIMFGVEAVPAVLFLVFLFFVPRSPRWLVGRGRADEARGVLEKLGTDEGRSIEQEIADIERSLAHESNVKREPLFRKKYRVPIMLAIAIATFNQLSGINAILYYAPEVFKSAGLDEQASFLSSVGVGLANLIFTMAALAVIDRIGRRKLMLVGSIGYIVSLGAVAASFYAQSGVDEAGVRSFTDAGGLVVLIGIAVFIASHAFGQGAVIWVFLSEIFPNRVRAKGQALGSLTHWVFAAVISWTFPMIAEASGGHVFTFYGVCMVGQLVWVLLVMPETKGVRLEEIESKLIKE